jgi:hypothetical protein
VRLWFRYRWARVGTANRVSQVWATEMLEELLTLSQWPHLSSASVAPKNDADEDAVKYRAKSNLRHVVTSKAYSSTGATLFLNQSYELAPKNGQIKDTHFEKPLTSLHTMVLSRVAS